MTSAPATPSGVAGSTGRVQRSRRRRRIALEPLALAEQHHADRIAALGEHARSDEAVAAIVAGPGHDHDAAARADARRPRRRPRGRHSPSASMPGMPPAIASRSASRHFVGGQQFDHAMLGH